MSDADPGPGPVPVPADIDREDRILAGLTARQLAILAAAAGMLWLAWTLTRRLVPPMVFAGSAAPFAAAAFALASGRRDGLSLDRWLAAGIRQAAAPRRLIPATGPVQGAPAWAGRAAARLAGPLPAPLQLPATAISDTGAITLGAGGAVAIAAATTVNLALRTGAEQEALCAALGRWLNSLQGPAQILIRACRIDLTAMAAQITATAPALPHPALEEAALGHAAFLTQLAASRDLLARQVLLAVRGPDPGAAARRLAGAARDLAAAGITLTPLDGPAATAALAACCAPGQPPPPAGTAPAGQVITARRPPGASPRPAGGAEPGSGWLPGPDAIQVAARHAVIGGWHAATLIVTGYPAEVGPGWLEPLTSYPGRLDVSLHIEPVPAPVAAAQLKRQRARLESGRRADSDKATFWL